MLELPLALRALASYKQFIIYRIVPSTTRLGKSDKFPIDYRTMTVGNAHDPAIWMDADTAVQTTSLLGGEWGVGFVFTDQDPFWFIDIDNCLDATGWNAIALELCNTLQGAAIEISQSGKGLHIFGSGVSPDHGCKNAGLGLEFYTEGRFVALTGTSMVGDAGFDASHLLPAIITKYFPPTTRGDTVEWRDTPVPEWSGPEDDDELITRMLASKPSAGATFNNNATLMDLWMANNDVLARAFPVQNDVDPYDRSSADAALAQHLAWWTGKNHARMERLMRMSALVRPKWDKHPTYMQMTVSSAVDRQVAVASLKVKKPTIFHENPAINTNLSLLLPNVSYTTGIQMLTANQMVDHFRGCVYVRDLHRVYTPDGSLLKSEQFNAIYGGYTFMMDAENDKSTRKAYEAFTECQSVKFPKASGVCFRPEIASGLIVEEEGRTLLNTYVPIDTTRKEGDITPFMDYLTRLLPNERDRTIVICYIASLVQNPGVKFQWCPMLQGAEGNGKTFIISCVAHAVGHRYTHLPKASEIDSKFNGWVTNMLFAGVEEIYTPDRRDILEGIKTLITNPRLVIERKGMDQYTGDNRVNFLISTNHKDGIPITTDTRRYAPFYCAQQTADDIKRDFPGDYFYHLYEWARNGGYEIVNNFLRTYQIKDEFNPATLCQRAPVTTSTAEALVVSMGTVEQEVMSAIEEGRPGFCGGWVSGQKLNELLGRIRADRRIPPNKRRELMKGLGYDWHPHLKDGRANNNVMVEGCKPKLYIKTGHLSCNLTEGASIVKAYMDAQGYPPMGLGVEATNAFR
jgi:hypothetical protein